MKSKPYICPCCGKADEFKPSLWQCLKEKFEWRCNTCGEQLESTIERGYRYWRLFFLLAASLTLVLYLTALLNDASRYLILYFLLIRLFLDLIIQRSYKISPLKEQVLSRFEKEELSDAELIRPRTIK